MEKRNILGCPKEVLLDTQTDVHIFQKTTKVGMLLIFANKQEVKKVAWLESLLSNICTAIGHLRKKNLTSVSAQAEIGPDKYLSKRYLARTIKR